MVARIFEVPHEAEDAFGPGIDWVHSGMDGVFQEVPRLRREGHVDAFVPVIALKLIVVGMIIHTAVESFVGALTVALGLQTSWVDRRNDAHVFRKCTTFEGAVADALLPSPRVWH